MAHALLKDKIIVGHSIKHDFDVMEFGEELRPKEKVRDLVKFKRYQNASVNPEGNVSHGAKGLKRLADEFLKVKI